MTANKNLARVAGSFYLVNVICSIFSLVFGPANNIGEHVAAFRAAVAAGLVATVSILLAALVLYAFFSWIDQRMAFAMVVLNAVGSAISIGTTAIAIGALEIATVPSYTTGLSTQAVQALVHLFLEINRLGIVLSFIFWALWLVPLGWLVYRSGWFPKALGIALIAACGGYLVAVVGDYFSPGFRWKQASYAELLGIAEIVFAVWLVAGRFRSHAAR
jgi:hypothetical protein